MTNWKEQVRTRQDRCIWSTSLPPHISANTGRKAVRRPKNTLEFLQETQRYIHNITQQSLFPVLSASPSPAPPRKRKKKPLATARRSAEALPTAVANSDYQVTKYVLARPLSPRLLPRLSEKPKVPSRLFTNRSIETFLNRFEAKAQLPGLTLNLRC